MTGFGAGETAKLAGVKYATLDFWASSGLIVPSIADAHGKGTEKRFMRAFPGHGFGPWIDTLLLSRAAWPDLTDHSLGALCDSRDLTQRVKSIVPEKSWHDALFDAVASLVLLEHLIETLALEDHPVEHLAHPDTSAWHRMKRS